MTKKDILKFIAENNNEHLLDFIKKNQTKLLLTAFASIFAVAAIFFFDALRRHVQTG